MPESLTRSSKIFIGVLVALGLAVAGAYIGLRYFRANDYSEEIDRMVQTKDSVVTALYFIRVADYDSINVREISANYVRSSVDSNALDVTKTRQYVFHMFTSADTTELTKDMLDELAYTNPRLTNPTQILRFVKNGWIISYTFAPYRSQPRSLDMVRTYFYVPRTGVKLKDIEL